MTQACPCEAFDRDCQGFVVPSMENRCYCGHEYEDHLDDGLSRCVERVAEPDVESTSAALARVERERQQALEDLATSEHAQHHIERERDDLSAELGRITAALDAFIADNQELSGRLSDAVDRSLAAKAELASAQQELDALRTVRDRVLADMAEQNAIILSQLCLRCGIELDAQLAAENTNPGTTPQGETS